MKLEIIPTSNDRFFKVRRAQIAPRPHTCQIHALHSLASYTTSLPKPHQTLFLPLPIATMATSTESDRYALPSLQYTRGDVLIKLGHEASDWLVVHSASLSEASPKLKAALSARWEATIGIDRSQHPRTGQSVNVKILALKFVEGTYFLEGKEVVEDRRWEAEVFQDSQWCSGWPFRGRGGQLVLTVTKRAFKVLFATIHGVDLTAEQVAGCSDDSEGRLENINASSWINWILLPQIVTVCAIA